MKRRYRTLLIVVISIVVAVSILLWVKRPKPVPVLLANVELGAVERTVTNTRAGTLNACRRAKLSPTMGGQIANLPVKEGDSVKAGQLLFEIWNEDLKAQVALAGSELKAARARAKEACVVADMAKRDANRLTKLLKKKITSDESAEQAVSKAMGTEAACEAATSLIEVSKSKLAVAEAALNRTRLEAPFDGTIAKVNGELGEYVTPSPIGIATQPAVDIIDTSCLYIAAPIDEVDAPKIKAGMSARISLDAFSKQFFDGNVRRVAPYVLDMEKQARTVDVEVDFVSEQYDHSMLPGYSADIEIIVDTRNNTLRIPSEALLEGFQVYIFDPDASTVSAVSVVVGLSNWKYSEITSGLTEGQQVVTSIDRERLEDGVEVVEEVADKPAKKR